MARKDYQSGRVLVNVEYPVYCLMVDETAETYDSDVKAIAPVMSVKMSSESEDNDLHGDGILQETDTTMGKITLEMQVNYLPAQVEADLRGHDYDETTGEMEYKSTDITPYAAFGYMVQTAGDQYIGVWILKGKLQEPNVEVTQKEGATTNYSTPTLSVSAVNRRTDTMNKKTKRGTREAIVEWLSTPASLAVDTSETVVTPPAGGSGSTGSGSTGTGN